MPDCDSDSSCGLPCNASARNAKSLALWVEQFGVGKGVFWKRGSFQKSPFSRDSREFRDCREAPDCGKQRRFRPFSRDSREFRDSRDISPVKRPLSRTMTPFAGPEQCEPLRSGRSAETPTNSPGDPSKLVDAPQTETNHLAEGKCGCRWKVQDLVYHWRGRFRRHKIHPKIAITLLRESFQGNIIYTPPPLTPFLARRLFSGGGGGVYILKAPAAGILYAPPFLYAPRRLFSGVGRGIKSGNAIIFAMIPCQRVRFRSGGFWGGATLGKHGRRG